MKIWGTSNYIQLGGYTGNKGGMNYSVTDKYYRDKLYPFQIRNRNGDSMDIYIYKKQQ